MKGAVSSGHPLTAQAAADMLTAGGNAFDAAVAAGFTSVVSEPTLTSLGGGGFMLAHIEEQKKDILFDFFVNTPGLKNTGKKQPVMTPVDIRFPECTQVFHTGMGSAAVPGMLKGLLHIHERLCSLPLHTILKPAIRCLEEGVKVTELQEHILNMLSPIFTSTDYARKIFMKNGRDIKKDDRLFNPQLKDFFSSIGTTGSIYSGQTAHALQEEMKLKGGMLTEHDLTAYEVVEREPLRIKYRGNEILTNPPPSSGGIMIALGLHMLDKTGVTGLDHGSDKYFITLIELLKELHDFKPMKNGSSIKYPFADAATDSLIESYRQSIAAKTFISTRGTTHISVIDEAGNAASMTTSNGSGSGCYIPKTGIMLNNMLGEDDLHPDGFFSSPPGLRVSSMMIPTIVLKDGKVATVMGSGGSKRIKTAVLQVLLNMIDYNLSVKDAVEKSRVHFEDGVVHAEPGISSRTTDNLRTHYPLNVWPTKNMYFGGVHCVNRDMTGWGDSRRGGIFLSV